MNSMVVCVDISHFLFLSLSCRLLWHWVLRSHKERFYMVAKNCNALSYTCTIIVLPPNFLLWACSNIFYEPTIFFYQPNILNGWLQLFAATWSGLDIPICKTKNYIHFLSYNLLYLVFYQCRWLNEPQGSLKSRICNQNHSFAAWLPFSKYTGKDF